MQLVKTVLDDLYSHIDASNEAEKDELLRVEIRIISDAYRRVATAPPGALNFSIPSKRFAYIYM
jgi:hypothetical protein